MTEETKGVDEFLNKFKLESTPSVVFIDKEGKLLSEDKIKYYTDKVLDEVLNQAMKRKDFVMLQQTLRSLLDAKKTWYPATQKAISANVNVFEDQLKAWVSVRQTMNNNSKEVIVEEVKTAEKELEEIDANGGR